MAPKTARGVEHVRASGVEFGKLLLRRGVVDVVTQLTLDPLLEAFAQAHFSEHIFPSTFFRAHVQ